MYHGAFYSHVRGRSICRTSTDVNLGSTAFKGMLRMIDYVDKDKRVSALALVNTASGFAGFLATLAVSPLVSYIQENGNSLFGMSLYAQQLLSLCSVFVVGGILVYLFLVVSKMKRNVEEN
jgi:hypothetical protein